MIVDSSAIVAVAIRELGHEALIGRLGTADRIGAGTPTLAETAIVLTARLGSDARGMLERLIQELRIEEIPFGEAHWRAALDAFERFGRGRHAARLNFGDCMAYAVAKLADQPLLYVGEDFARTDIASARGALP
ncbi:MAG: type II toxin-antitoxin system VapC family toxin [Longimicrobiales bacterium]